jgi:Ca2+-binding RTX toxin-like protein
LNITATAASDVTFAIATSTAVDTIVGDANTTLVGGVSLADFTGLTISGAAAVSGAGGTSDLTDVSSAITVSTGANAALTVADGASVELAAVMAGANNVAIIAEDDADTTAAAERSVTVTLSDDTTDAAGALGSYEVTITHDATGNDDEITTVNMVVTGDVDHAAGHEGDATLILTDNEIATTVNISGAGDIDLATTTDAANDVTLNAAALTGALDYIITDGVGSVTGGSGDDRIEIETTTEADATIAGGAGDDTLVADAAGSDIGGMTISGFEIISGAFTGLASQFSGADYVVAAGSSISINTATDVDASTIDLSGMTFAADTLVVTVDLTQLATSLPANTAFNYTGSGGADTVTGSANDDTITGGAGIDTLTAGAGDDTVDGGAAGDLITGGTGADSLTGGAGSDTFIFATTGADAGITAATADTIKDFTLTTNAGAAGESIGDILDFATTTAAIGSTTTDANISAVTAGKITFVDATLDLSDLLTDAFTATNAADEAVFFVNGGNTYVVQQGDTSEQVIILEGVEATSLLLDATLGGTGDIAADQFVLA